MREVNPRRAGRQDVVVGVDTHKHVHVAAVVSMTGDALATLTIVTEQSGYQQLLQWAASFGRVIAFGIEGTGSYGAALTSFLRRSDQQVIEVNRPARRLRRMNGISDTLDAENAARAVLSGFASAVPKTADGNAEMIRQLKAAHDTAVKGSAAAMVTMKALLAHAADELRQESARMTQIKLARYLANLSPASLETPGDANRHALRALARDG